jgi:hypothetical protein
VPDVAKPALHVQVAAPALLLLLTGHAVHKVSPGVARNVLARQATGESHGRETTMACA